MPRPSREGSGLKLNMLTIAQQVRHKTQPHPGSWSPLRGGERKQEAQLLFLPPQSFAPVFSTPHHYKVQEEWIWSVTSNVIGMLQKKAGKKGELIHSGSTGIAQGCNKARRTLGQARLQRHIMCSTQSRNKYAILNIFQVYFQKKSRAKMEIAIWY